ncbi:response regulator [Bacteriovorax sp. PP10]|uniref:Response regulator n=1 Tax=Bacteriovorax antarcticus TaxID=3088717 RepID=A0ABU5VS25_9BACT|nr:response regulator [Bacteriovorax sp. PP10]MEA9355801.1 response regulator [Bacteriovorax sp. PP10]
MKKNKIKILIVDDEVELLKMIADEFVSRGHNVMTAANGNEAIAKIQISLPEVVLCDYKMPSGNGLDVLNYVKSLGKNKPTFFFISGHSELTPEECIAAGARNFFAKPFDIDEMITQVENEFNMDKLGLKISFI